MLLGDIAARHNVRNVDALRTLVKKVAETVRTDVSFSTPHNALKDIGYGISKDTVISYVGHAREAYLLFSVTNATARFVKRGGRAGMAVPTGRARSQICGFAWESEGNRILGRFPSGILDVVSPTRKDRRAS